MAEVRIGCSKTGTTVRKQDNRVYLMLNRKFFLDITSVQGFCIEENGIFPTVLNPDSDDSRSQIHRVIFQVIDMIQKDNYRKVIVRSMPKFGQSPEPELEIRLDGDKLEVYLPPVLQNELFCMLADVGYDMVKLDVQSIVAALRNDIPSTYWELGHVHSPRLEALFTVLAAYDLGCPQDLPENVIK